MEYVIACNDNKYVKLIEGKPFSYTTSILAATHYPIEESAQKFIKSNIKVTQRIYHKVIPDTLSSLICTPIKEQLEELSVKDDDNICGDMSTIEFSEDYKTVFEEDDYDINIVCADISRFFRDIPIYKEKLCEQFKQVENEACDMRHRIEFPKDNGKEFNAFELLNFCKQYRNILRRRRKIKDDALKMDILLESSLDDFSGDKVSKRFDGLESRTYRPRVLTELFENK